MSECIILFEMDVHKRFTRFGFKRLVFYLEYYTIRYNLKFEASYSRSEDIMYQGVQNGWKYCSIYAIIKVWSGLFGLYVMIDCLECITIFSFCYIKNDLSNISEILFFDNLRCLHFRARFLCPYDCIEDHWPSHQAGINLQHKNKSVHIRFIKMWHVIKNNLMSRA